MSEHTPGPWRWDGNCCLESERTDTPGYGQVMDAYVSCGQYCYGGEAVVDISGPNARLIAAAPELLEALEAFIEEFDGCYAEGEPAMIKARAAIAKARGE